MNEIAFFSGSDRIQATRIKGEGFKIAITSTGTIPDIRLLADASAKIIRLSGVILWVMTILRGPLKDKSKDYLQWMLT